MDTTIRNLDKEAYRALKARAALTGRTIGEVLNEAILQYLQRQPAVFAKTRSLRDLKPIRYPKGTERLSESIDREVYRS